MSGIQFTDEQLRILRHMLGIDDATKARPEPYRDYYCANPGDPSLHELQRLGAVRLYSSRDSYEWFTCTTAGKLAAMRSFRTIQLPKKKRVYLKYLSLSDCWSDLTFHRFLTDPYFDAARRDA